MIAEEKPILQLKGTFNDEGIIWEEIKEWKSIVEIKDALLLPHSLINQALKKGYKGAGFWWIYKDKYEKGERPAEGIQVRNQIIYAYTLEDTCLGKFENAILAGRHLGVSVSNVRKCAKGEIPKLREFKFTHIPKRKEESQLKFTKVLI